MFIRPIVVNQEEKVCEKQTFLMAGVQLSSSPGFTTTTTTAFLHIGLTFEPEHDPSSALLCTLKR